MSDLRAVLTWSQGEQQGARRPHGAHARCSCWRYVQGLVLCSASMLTETMLWTACWWSTTRSVALQCNTISVECENGTEMRQWGLPMMSSKAESGIVLYCLWAESSTAPAPRCQAPRPRSPSRDVNLTSLLGAKVLFSCLPLPSHHRTSGLSY